MESAARTEQNHCGEVLVARRWWRVVRPGWRRRWLSSWSGRSWCWTCRRGTCRTVALVMDSPGGGCAGAHLARCRLFASAPATAARSVILRRRIFTRKRVGSDRFFAFLDDREVVRTAMGRHLRASPLHRFSAITGQLNHATALVAANHAGTATGGEC